MTLLWHDLRYALRTLRQSPGFAAAAIGTLALGIGANTAIFSVMDAVLLRPLPYPASERLALVGDRTPSGGAGNVGFLTFLDLRARNRTFASMSAIRLWAPTLLNGGEAERVPAMRVSGNFFDVLGVRPALGRGFLAEEDRPDRWRVLVLSDGLWRRRFGADPSVIGRRIRMNDADYQIIGVMPASYEPLLSAHFYQAAQMWAPMGYDPAASNSCRSCQHLKAFGRLREGVSFDQARSDLDRVRRELAAEYPTDYPAGVMAAIPLGEELTGRIRPALYVLFGAVGFVLLIACANVANLMLARSFGRSREMAVRSALGASRGRLLRQLLTESLILSAAGGAAGVAAAIALQSGLAGLAPISLPRIDRIAIDWRVLGFGALVTVGTGALAGLLPALRLSASGLSQAMASGARSSAGAASTKARRLLAIADLTLAVVLLVGAGLMLKSVTRVLRVPLGFQPDRVLTLQLSLVGTAYAEDSRVLAFQDRLLARVREIPGVEGAALAGQIPLGGNGDEWGFHVQGRSTVNPAEDPNVERYAVTADYFRVMGVGLKRGRLVGADDRADSPPVLVVSETAASSLFPGQDPIGQRVRIGDSESGPWRTIVGIAGDVRHFDLSTAPRPQMYSPQSQTTDSYLTLVVKSAARRPELLAGPIRQIVHAIDPSVPIYEVARMADLVDRAAAQRRFVMRLLGGFAAVALILAAIGLYGVVSYSVAQRRREFGIRLALGARPGDVFRVVLREGLAIVGAGLAAGVLSALALTRFLTSLLFEVGAGDPATILGALLVLALVSLAAHWAPARRATRVDPMVALRSE